MSAVRLTRRGERVRDALLLAIAGICGSVFLAACVTLGSGLALAGSR